MRQESLIHLRAQDCAIQYQMTFTSDTVVCICIYVTRAFGLAWILVSAVVISGALGSSA